MTPNIQFLSERAALLRELREFFDDRGFVEVQMPCLSRDCVVDAYIDPIAVPSSQLHCPAAGLPDDLYLQTSPELAMKRLLAAGAPSIYCIGPVFRAGERGRLHNPEFTMLEWYEVDSGMQGGVELLGSLVNKILGRSAFDVCTYRELFHKFLGVDPIDAHISQLHKLVSPVDVQLSDRASNDRDTLLDIILSSMIQPHLGHNRPQIVTEYPLSQAALAKTSANDDQCAARFELFASGIEIANGYDELLEADVLIDRAKASNEKRIADGRDELKIESSLVRAMRDGLPSCAGVALGVDRLLMIRVGAESIDQVIPIPIEIA